MKNLWNKSHAAKYKDDLDLRVYSSRLLGKDTSLVLHGGGNTSVNSFYTDIFNQKSRVIFVKGSGWDMSNLNHQGIPGLTTSTKDDNKKSTKVMEELSIVDRVKLFKWEWKL